jgi:CHAD domain-containing protein
MGKPEKTHGVASDARAAPDANARRTLPPAAARFFSQTRDLLARNPVPADLHPLRLEAKRLRYTLELFRPCYGPGLEARIEALRALQTVLGQVNDAGVAARIVAQSMGSGPQRSRVLAFLERRAARKTREFHMHWTNVFDAPGQEGRWTEYLARNARPPDRGR